MTEKLSGASDPAHDGSKACSLIATILGELSQKLMAGHAAATVLCSLAFCEPRFF
jgi:hypothetical protein